jgi:hypothetical protein
VKKYLPYVAVALIAVMAADRIRGLPGLNKLPRI